MAIEVAQHPVGSNLFVLHDPGTKINEQGLCGDLLPIFGLLDELVNPGMLPYGESSKGILYNAPGLVVAACGEALKAQLYHLS